MHTEPDGLISEEFCSSLTCGNSREAFNPSNKMTLPKRSLSSRSRPQELLWTPSVRTLRPASCAQRLPVPFPPRPDWTGQLTRHPESEMSFSRGTNGKATVSAVCCRVKAVKTHGHFPSRDPREGVRRGWSKRGRGGGAAEAACTAPGPAPPSARCRGPTPEDDALGAELASALPAKGHVAWRESCGEGTWVEQRMAFET